MMERRARFSRWRARQSLALSEWAGGWRHRLRRVLQQIPEIITISAGVSGWLLLVAAVADIVANPVPIWKAGFAILLLGICGFKVLFKIFAEGVYVWAKRDELLTSARSPQRTPQPTDRSDPG